MMCELALSYGLLHLGVLRVLQFVCVCARGVNCCCALECAQLTGVVAGSTGLSMQG